MTDFSILIISYNGKEFLRRCLNAVQKSVLKPKKIIIVDDFSSDGTEESIKKEFNYADFIRNKENLGPTASRNRGAKLADGEYIIFLDNDILLRPDTLQKLIIFMDSNPKTAIAGAKIIPIGRDKMWWNAGWDMNHFRQSTGYFIGFLLKIFPNSRFLKNLSMKFILNYWDYDKTLKVDWVVEGCFIIRKSVFNKLNGFDEKFLNGHEGADLCLRARNIGHDVYFYSEAQADNLGNHTHTPIKRRLWLFKGEYYFYKKHYFYKKSNPIIFWFGRIISGIFYLFS